ncbi:MAG: hypothetical protein P3W84_001860 [Thermodesulfobacteriaceae bacterium]|nr:hypothetical protein [Thermodesulfobacteriaceae bacterium]
MSVQPNYDTASSACVGFMVFFSQAKACDYLAIYEALGYLIITLIFGRAPLKWRASLK